MTQNLKNLRPVSDMKMGKLTADKIIKQMYEGGGFTAKKVADGVDILETMENQKDCIKFLSFPADIIATGTRGIIKDIVKHKLADVIITTCGTLDHDLARLWKEYYHGKFEADDTELREKGINRLGNIFVPNESYGIILEEKMQKVMDEIYGNKETELGTSEIIRGFGKAIENEKNADESIVYWAYKNNIPVFVPGITDGAFGFQLFMFWQNHKNFRVNLFKDEKALADIVFTAKNTGALMLGGGISKHHTIWWNQFRDGLNFAVFITTAVESDGSLSGARTREAISWGKINEKAKHITIEGDVTVLLPLMADALFERMKI
ncbi:MAG: deoxyhypusine synthase [Candidatus Altiarchaeum hamiconexum]|uniref:Deoxyhypusine synthase n=1 Tax=Candidatus Altarchaeum hamiconexum TaxID=1803513 RepID=A0A8J7YXE4_9ARCH|nr:deoxyhypusine synthase [Candidatus Altarchaeum hamiconexum]OIQ04760.1 MAG: deoxyhypusine synthase [Candidatus Altarchaeum sp. CG2_30_32_3053]PIN66977.1 MAG: deoxyhypusine synthase [Candidatus Altarchaeum sp. CG12_big_fil_rev_8_21_14_0_65_33_22]PIV28682.1 MAG: deoxyhypusine synthase [Candidatus Altarchaeum sp. CG03_land_8_20_14_0_80_32_618]PIZ29359.1 MAG: deoxyhypusine synthase [Candidatus Altarchaeum sp. CG_4_10_14_0_8_um_filter_32_851]PJC14865.1 MAG: deoxyhypusine synthase [Candidatus Alta